MHPYGRDAEARDTGEADVHAGMSSSISPGSHGLQLFAIASVLSRS